MKTVRWGLICTAHINRVIIPAIRSSKRGTLAAVSSRSIESARAYAQEWEIPQAFGSYEEMLNSDEIDAVYISLPNHLHAEWSIRALRAGKHVLCEKPFALTVDEVDRMSAASRESGCALAEAFMYRHHPQTKLVGEWVKGGRLGDISLVKSYFSFSMRNREGNVRMVPEYGGGALWDVGIYPVSFSQYIMGGELPQWAAGTQRIGPTGVDEDFAGLLSFAGQRAATIGCSFRAPFNTYAEIIGSEGRLVITRPFLQMDSPERAVIFYPNNGVPQKVRVPRMELYSGEIEDLQNAVLDQKPTYISLQESRNHVAVAQALYQAAAAGQTVAVGS